MTHAAQFRAGLLDARLPVPPGLTDGQGRPAGRRYAVYRNNVAVTLTEAIITGFPAIASLLGADNMQRVAGAFIRQEQPRTPILSQYGAGFPAFLAEQDQLSHLPYLADVARIDLAMRLSYHAADHTPLNPAILAQPDEATLMATRLSRAPSLETVSSRWPACSIWRYAMGRTADKPAGEAEDVAILRAEFDPVPVVLPTGGQRFLDALRADATLGDAIAAAGDGFDVAATLTLLLSHNALATPQPKG
ncbi:hypothetical protein SAMN05421759_102321 [Roseivivax lentus]|uniref:Putative DNA-binding domain-containing protein n=1 Tax=Roseivivax lentus TaxID=633194 RepID=A0A1N7L2V6_9RHOB|nr:DNA-binding domain-containing protein [Roseivivax lentus]SIS68117.1 hypothetical protein SAMN05421759_102321 [Roseivivax lentus]